MIDENYAAVIGDGDTIDQIGGEGEWYVKEAHPLGVIFGIQEEDDGRLKSLLEDLNLNFGVNGKCEKRQRKGNGGGAEGGDIRVVCSSNGS